MNDTSQNSSKNNLLGANVQRQSTLFSEYFKIKV